jgi:hypothetical protein
MVQIKLMNVPAEVVDLEALIETLFPNTTKLIVLYFL